MRTITGTLKAPSGQLLRGVTIGFTALDSIPQGVPKGAKSKVTTDLDGHYSIGIIPGEYMVSLDNGGPSRTIAPQITVNDGPDVDLMLLVGAQDIPLDELNSILNGLLSAANEATEAAQVSAESANDSAVSAGLSAAKAQEWAGNPENVEIEAGQYSALHHAAKAGQSATLANAKADDANVSAQSAAAHEESASTSAVAASASEANAADNASAASASKNYASEWANAPEDSLVSAAAGGDQVDDYSALHHARKAESSAAAASSFASAASTSETNSANNASSASTSALNAATSASAAESDRQEVAANTGVVETKAAEVESARAEVATNKDLVAADKVTVAGYVGDAQAAAAQAGEDATATAADRAAVATDKTAVTTKATEVEAARAEVATNTAQVSADKDTVAADKLTVSGYVDDAQAAATQTGYDAAATAADRAAVEAKASEVEVNRTAVATDAAAASVSETNASDSASLAQKWANEGEDVLVSGSEYSAKHYAAKSSQSANAAQSSASAASDSETAADASEAKAQQWAENAEDVEVEPGLYSAKHHAAKSAQSAADAQAAEQGASAVGLSTSLAALTDDPGYAFGSADTLQNALEALQVTGVGGATTLILTALDSFTKWFDIPMGAAFRVSDSASKAFLNNNADANSLLVQAPPAWGLNLTKTHSYGENTTGAIAISDFIGFKVTTSGSVFLSPFHIRVRKDESDVVTVFMSEAWTNSTFDPATKADSSLTGFADNAGYAFGSTDTVHTALEALQATGVGAPGGNAAALRLNNLTSEADLVAIPYGTIFQIDAGSVSGNFITTNLATSFNPFADMEGSADHDTSLIRISSSIDQARGDVVPIFLGMTTHRGRQKLFTLQTDRGSVKASEVWDDRSFDPATKSDKQAPEYSVSTLPAATDNARVIVYVTDDVGGPTMAYSDGTNWVRMYDRVVVSAT